MTTTSHNREIIATRCVIEKANTMLINGIGETAKSNPYPIRDYSRKATKDKTPLRYITRVAQPANINAWLIANAHNGAMVRTINSVTHFEIGHALAVFDNSMFENYHLQYPLMPKGTRRNSNARGVSVERALSIYDND